MPNPYYDQGETWFCDEHCYDIEPDDDACNLMKDRFMECRQCPHAMKQSYSICTQRADQKHLI